MSRFFHMIHVLEKEMTGTQRILVTESDFGLWRNLLSRDSLTIHQLAGRIKKYSDRYGKKMPSEHELGHALLRLVQEGLVGMSGSDQGPLIKFKRLHELAVMPVYKKTGDAGADVSSVEDVTLAPGETQLVDLGFAMEIEPGWEVQVRPRSGLATKGITVMNSPGTIDSGYRGPCKVILHNGGSKNFAVRKKDRVAQFVVKRAPQARFEEVEELSDSDRGEGGFGSTGI